MNLDLRLPKFTLKTPEDYAKCKSIEKFTSKKYFNGSSLEDVIMQYPYPSHSSQKEKKKGNLDFKLCPLIKLERKLRRIFLDFLSGLLQMDPMARWTASQAIQHPFITGRDISIPFSPDPSLSRRSVPLVPKSRSRTGSGPIPIASWGSASKSLPRSIPRGLASYRSSLFEESSFYSSGMMGRSLVGESHLDGSTRSIPYSHHHTTIPLQRYEDLKNVPSPRQRESTVSFSLESDSHSLGDSRPSWLDKSHLRRMTLDASGSLPTPGYLSSFSHHSRAGSISSSSGLSPSASEFVPRLGARHSDPRRSSLPSGAPSLASSSEDAAAGSWEPLFPLE
jgi:serine/threonine protein kinase